MCDVSEMYPPFEEYAKEELNKKFGIHAVEARLIVSVSASFNEDEACLLVATEYMNDDTKHVTVRNSFHGREATDMYYKLIGHEA